MSWFVKLFMVFCNLVLVLSVLVILLWVWIIVVWFLLLNLLLMCGSEFLVSLCDKYMVIWCGIMICLLCFFFLRLVIVIWKYLVIFFWMMGIEIFDSLLLRCKFFNVFVIKLVVIGELFSCEYVCICVKVFLSFCMFELIWLVI